MSFLCNLAIALPNRLSHHLKVYSIPPQTSPSQPDFPGQDYQRESSSTVSFNKQFLQGAQCPLRSPPVQRNPLGSRNPSLTQRQNGAETQAWNCSPGNLPGSRCQETLKLPFAFIWEGSAGSWQESAWSWQGGGSTEGGTGNFCHVPFKERIGCVESPHVLLSTFVNLDSQRWAWSRIWS